MSLEKALKEARCSDEFIKIAQLYASDYVEGSDIEVFIESVEERHAVVEAEEYNKELQERAEKAKKILAMNDLFDEDENDDMSEEEMQKYVASLKK